MIKSNRATYKTFDGHKQSVLQVAAVSGPARVNRALQLPIDVIELLGW